MKVEPKITRNRKKLLHTFDNASIAPSMWLRSLLSKQVTRAGKSSGHPETPSILTITLMIVPTVVRIFLSTAPRQGNNSDLMYFWFSWDMEGYAPLKLFFRSNPAAWRTSTDLPWSSCTSIHQLGNRCSDLMHNLIKTVCLGLIKCLHLEACKCNEIWKETSSRDKAQFTILYTNILWSKGNQKPLGHRTCKLKLYGSRD